MPISMTQSAGADGTSPVRSTGGAGAGASARPRGYPSSSLRATQSCAVSRASLRMDANNF